MKKLGAALLLIGILGLLFSLSLDTTVPSSSLGSTNRIHNIGLMNEKQNLIIFFSVISMLGGAFVSIYRNNKPNHEKFNSTPSVNDQKNRTCPYCAETIKSKAVLCRYCGQRLEPSDDNDSTDTKLGTDSNNNSTLFEKISNYIYQSSKAIESLFSLLAKNNISIIAISYLKKLYFALSNNFKIFGFIFITSGIWLFIYLIYFRDWDELYQFYESIGTKNVGYQIYQKKIADLLKSIILILSGIVIFTTKLTRSKKCIYEIITKRPSSSIYILGHNIDLCIAVVVLILGTAWLQSSGNVELSQNFTFVAIAISLLLFFNKGYKIFSALALITSSYYLITSHILLDSLQFAMQQLIETMKRSSVEYVLTPSLYLSILAAGVLFPHIQSVRLGGFLFGSTYGDFNIKIFNHTIHIPIISSLFLYILVLGTIELYFLISSFI